MAFDLSFSPEFFFGEAEPYDGGNAVNEQGQPCSIWAALELLKQDDAKWSAMCADCFPDDPPGMVTLESVMELIRSTNTCGNLTVPVNVWIDECGDHSVLVWDDTVSP